MQFPVLSEDGELYELSTPFKTELAALSVDAPWYNGLSSPSGLSSAWIIIYYTQAISNETTTQEIILL